MFKSMTLLVILSAGTGLQAASYTPYPVDMIPLSKYPELSREWNQLRSDVTTDGPETEGKLKRLLEIAETVSASESEWTDGLWMVSDAAFNLGSFYQNPKDLDFARSVFVRGQKAVEKCLERSKEHVICKLFLGAMIGKIASIDGIFSSLRKAQTVHQLWLDVTESTYDHRISADTTLQGSARYALGLFYRLVPDSTLLKWVFGVRGDIEKSIVYHREALTADGSTVCNEAMLGVALICAATKNDKDETRIKEGLAHLRDAEKIVPRSSVAKSCAKDLRALMADKSLACGYETSKQQDLDESKIQK